MKKYYWYVAYLIWYHGQDGMHEVSVTDMHPFQLEHDRQSYPAAAGGTIFLWELRNWKEITEEEYNLYKKLQDE